MRKRKFESLLMGEGAYYHPRASLGSLAHNYRYQFLEAIEKRTPEVLANLRHRVWPHYDSMYWHVNPPISPEQWLYTIHPQLVWDWMVDKKPENWNSRANRFLTPLKRQLFAWSARYQFHTDWMLMQGMDTMFYWTETDSFTIRRISTPSSSEIRSHRAILSLSEIGSAPVAECDFDVSGC